jgi:hypothetical protein
MLTLTKHKLLSRKSRNLLGVIGLDPGNRVFALSKRWTIKIFLFLVEVWPEGHWRRVVAANRAATCELLMVVHSKTQRRLEFRYTTGTNKTTT